MAHLSTEKERAFRTLSIQAQLHLELEEVTTDQKKLMVCIRYAARIGREESLSTINELTQTNFKIILKLINSYLDSGITPDSNDNNLSALFLAYTFPELVKLLLSRSANPNFQNNCQNTPLHHLAWFFSPLYKEKLFITAELLAAAGANLNAKNNRGKTPLDRLKEATSISSTQLTEIEARFKEVTEHPRNFDEIPVQLLEVEESTPSHLQLTETDNIKIALYKQGRYLQLINQDPTYQAINTFSGNSVTPRSSRSVGNNAYHPSQLFSRIVLQEKQKILKEAQTYLNKDAFNFIFLNGTQKNIIEGTLKFIFDDIASSLTTPPQAIKALNAILSSTLTNEEIENFKEKNVWESIKQIRDILVHPCPQNRNQGNASAYWHGVLKGRDPASPEEISGCQTGVSNGIVYYYKEGFGSQILTEPQGVLGLTSRNDKTAPAVTKEAVVYYINQLIQNEIKQYQNKDAALINNDNNLSAPTMTITPRF